MHKPKGVAAIETRAVEWSGVEAELRGGKRGREGERERKGGEGREGKW